MITSKAMDCSRAGNEASLVPQVKRRVRHHMPQPPLFIALNRHLPECGSAPSLDDVSYSGYFENEHGEQAVFVYDKTKRQGTLWLGDISWEKPYRMNSSTPPVGLNEPERLWLDVVGPQQRRTRRQRPDATKPVTPVVGDNFERGPNNGVLPSPPSLSECGYYVVIHRYAVSRAAVVRLARAAVHVRAPRGE